MAWPEWQMLRHKTGHTLGAFIFEEVLCHWGGVEEIIRQWLSICSSHRLVTGMVWHHPHKNFPLQLSHQWLSRAPTPDNSRINHESLQWQHLSLALCHATHLLGGPHHYPEVNQTLPI